MLVSVLVSLASVCCVVRSDLIVVIITVGPIIFGTVYLSFDLTSL